MDPIGALCYPLALKMWSVHGDLDGGPRLIFPFKRSDTVRVSEQESKVMLCQVLEQSRWFYSVETPTREMYMQTGTHALSARIDVTVYGSRSKLDRVLNIELKAGFPKVENFRKDFEKLVREGVNGLWFHTLEQSNNGTLPRLLERFRQAISLVGSHATTAGHTLNFAVCLLDKQVLLSAQIQLGVDLERQLEAMFGANTSGWRVFGSGKDAYEGGGALGQSGAAVPRPAGGSRRMLDRSVQEKLLIFCPQITDDTLLHFSQVGDSYQLRAFVGRLVWKKHWAQPDARTASRFLQLYRPVETIDVRDERISLEKKDLWAAVVTRYNRRSGIGN